MAVGVSVDKSTYQLGETVTVSWNVKNFSSTSTLYYKVEFYLDGALLKTIDVGQVAPLVKESGAFTFSAPSTAGSYTLTAVSYTSFNGRDWMDEDSQSVTFTVEGVDIESVLMQELKRWYKKNVTVPGVTKPYDWSFDVTDTVIESGLIKNVDKAYLYGWYEIKSYSYAGKERPPKRSARDKVSGWQDGTELALLRISTTDYDIPEEYAGWYWVTVPCKLVVVQKEAPKAVIIKDVSKYPNGLGGIVYNGRVLPPGSYTVTKGSKIEYYALAENIGGEGTIWLRLLVDGQEVDRSEDSKMAGIAGTITANADMTIKFEAGHGTTIDDTWGC